MTAKPQQYNAAGSAVWHGTGRVMCETDTETAAKMVAEMLNYAVANGYKWKPDKEQTDSKQTTRKTSDAEECWAIGYKS
jgi:hypothetical protein